MKLLEGKKVKALWGMLAMGMVLGAGAKAEGQTKIVAGPMVGHVSENSARLWMQLNTSETVSIQVFDLVSSASVGGLRMDVSGPAPFIFDAPLTGLKPNRNYRVEVLFDGKPVTLPEPPVVIRTAPPVGEATSFTLGVGGGFSPAAVKANGGQVSIIKDIGKVGARAFIFLGNNGYLPVQLTDWPQSRRQGMKLLADFYHNVRVTPELQELLRTSACYGTWDEHDFGCNDSDMTFPFAAESRAALMRFWPNPDYGVPGAGGVFYTMNLGDVDVFVLDNRSFRTPLPGAEADSDVKVEKPAMLGTTQLEWLKTNLKNSTAAFKVVACPTPMLPEYDGKAQWSAYPEERKEFIKFIRQSEIKGVMLVSSGVGEGGIGELSVLPAGKSDINPYPIYELTVPALALPEGAQGSGTGVVAENYPNTLREGPLVGDTGGQGFGTLEFGGPKSKRHVTLKIRDRAGQVRLEKVIFAAELNSAP